MSPTETSRLSRGHRPLLGVAALVLGCTTLAGCSVSRDKSSADPAPSTSGPTQSSQATDQPTDQPTPSATPSATTSAVPTPSGSALPSTGATSARSRLLGGDELPRLNPRTPWHVVRTGAPSTRPVGYCQKFDLLTIGARSAVERTWTTIDTGSHTPQNPDTAVQQVAEFPDAQNTVRAEKVLEAWQRDCRGRVPGTSVKVRPITDVATSQGHGWWYLLSFERGGEGHFQAFGAAVSGNRMTVVRMDHAGQDHNYPAGKDPVELALKAAASRLG